MRVFEDVQVAESPLWLKARLMAVGQRPISNVVDITNYVMLLLGQPMHAYDLDRVAGPELHVRAAREGERLTTLDGEERVFDGDAVLVCDARGPTGIGGIMGGSASEVSADTTRVAMEAATWNGTNILKTSKKLGLRTEASNRFEKQLHPRLALQAQHLAARLMVELCGARMVPGTIDVAAPEPEPHRIGLRGDRLDALLGQPIPPEESQAILERLGFGVERHDRDLEAVVPYFRHYDVYREADLIEEVARVHGLQRLPATLPARRRAVGSLSRTQKLRRGDRGPAARGGLQRGGDVQLRDARGGAHAAGRRQRRARPGPAGGEPAQRRAVGDAHDARPRVCSRWPATTSPATCRTCRCSSAGGCSSRRGATTCPTSGCTSGSC